MIGCLFLLRPKKPNIGFFFYDKIKGVTI